MSDAQRTAKQKPMAQECRMLGCQRSVADKLIQELRRENAELRERLVQIAKAAHQHSELCMRSAVLGLRDE